jgi:hypothetical protein
MFDPMGLDSAMQTLLLMQIEQRLADIGRVQRGLPTLAQEQTIQELLARERKDVAAPGGRLRDAVIGKPLSRGVRI